MRAIVGDVEAHYVEHGRGRVVLALHGAGVDHREIEAWLEPILAARTGYCRIYPDLPGMGLTPATESLTGNDDVVTVLIELLDQLAPGEPFMVLGHSYGAFLARAVVARCRDRAIGLALLCPIGGSSGDLPAHEVAHSEIGTSEVLPAEKVEAYEAYFVVRTPATAQRYLDAVDPGVTLADEAGLERIFSNWAVRERPGSDGPYAGPALILAGRQDATAGWASAADLLPDYPHATYAVIDGAGHALPHEHPGLVAAFVDDWIDRTVRADPGVP